MVELERRAQKLNEMQRLLGDRKEDTKKSDSTIRRFKHS